MTAHPALLRLLRAHTADMVGGIEPIRALILADVAARPDLRCSDVRPVQGSDLARLYHALLDALDAAVRLEGAEGVGVTVKRDLVKAVFSVRWMLAHQEEERAPAPAPGRRLRRVHPDIDGLASNPMQYQARLYGVITAEDGAEQHVEIAGDRKRTRELAEADVQAKGERWLAGESVEGVYPLATEGRA